MDATGCMLDTLTQLVPNVLLRFSFLMQRRDLSRFPKLRFSETLFFPEKASASITCAQLNDVTLTMYTVVHSTTSDSEVPKQADLFDAL